MSSTKQATKQRNAEKFSRIPIKIPVTTQPLPKPDWLRIKLKSGDGVNKLKKQFRRNKLVTVCEEAACPNINECFSHGTASFMIMGDKCTRRCTFCDVAHGRPDPLDPDEPINLAKTIKEMGLKYVVITSVDRDDLRDGGAGHFRDCTLAVRAHNPGIKVEVLVPDFRGRMEKALAALAEGAPDVFNHNIETVPRLYRAVRPGSDYKWSLMLLASFYEQFPAIPTKSGIMLGLGETREEVEQVMLDLRDHHVSMITLGQYLQPSKHHSPVKRYVSPEEFDQLGQLAKKMQFTHVASGPFVRSSYHADLLAAGKEVKG